MKIISNNIINNIGKNKINDEKSLINNNETDNCTLGIEISSRAEFPYNILSNFSPTSFVLDGVVINSIEGFLQSLKVSDKNLQQEICKLSGIKAKGIGKKLNKKRNYDFKHLYWQGKHISRFSPEYYNLLERAYEERFKADENFRFALEYTENRILRHSIGEKDKARTLLTEKEFVGILTKLRDSIKH